MTREVTLNGILRATYGKLMTADGDSGWGLCCLSRGMDDSSWTGIRRFIEVGEETAPDRDTDGWGYFGVYYEYCMFAHFFTQFEQRSTGVGRAYIQRDVVLVPLGEFRKVNFDTYPVFANCFPAPQHYSTLLTPEPESCVVAKRSYTGLTRNMDYFGGGAGPILDCILRDNPVCITWSSPDVEHFSSLLALAPKPVRPHLSFTTYCPEPEKCRCHIRITRKRASIPGCSFINGDTGEAPSPARDSIPLTPVGDLVGAGDWEGYKLLLHSISHSADSFEAEEDLPRSLAFVRVVCGILAADEKEGDPAARIAMLGNAARNIMAHPEYLAPFWSLLLDRLPAFNPEDEPIRNNLRDILSVIFRFADQESLPRLTALMLGGDGHVQPRLVLARLSLLNDLEKQEELHGSLLRNVSAQALDRFPETLGIRDFLAAEKLFALSGREDRDLARLILAIRVGTSLSPENMAAVLSKITTARELYALCNNESLHQAIRRCEDGAGLFLVDLATGVLMPKQAPERYAPFTWLEQLSGKLISHIRQLWLQKGSGPRPLLLLYKALCGLEKDSIPEVDHWRYLRELIAVMTIPGLQGKLKGNLAADAVLSRLLEAFPESATQIMGEYLQRHPDKGSFPDCIITCIGDAVEDADPAAFEEVLSGAFMHSDDAANLINALRNTVQRFAHRPGFLALVTDRCLACFSPERAGNTRPEILESLSFGLVRLVVETSSEPAPLLRRIRHATTPVMGLTRTDYLSRLAIAHRDAQVPPERETASLSMLAAELLEQGSTPEELRTILPDEEFGAVFLARLAPLFSSSPRMFEALLLMAARRGELKALPLLAGHFSQLATATRATLQCEALAHLAPQEGVPFTKQDAAAILGMVMGHGQFQALSGNARLAGTLRSGSLPEALWLTTFHSLLFQGRAFPKDLPMRNATIASSLPYFTMAMEAAHVRGWPDGSAESLLRAIYNLIHSLQGKTDADIELMALYIRAIELSRHTPHSKHWKEIHAILQGKRNDDLSTRLISIIHILGALRENLWNYTSFTSGNFPFFMYHQIRQNDSFRTIHNFLSPHMKALKDETVGHFIAGMLEVCNIFQSRDGHEAEHLKENCVRVLALLLMDRTFELHRSSSSQEYLKECYLDVLAHGVLKHCTVLGRREIMPAMILIASQLKDPAWHRRIVACLASEWVPLSGEEAGLTIRLVRWKLDPVLADPLMRRLVSLDSGSFGRDALFTTLMFDAVDFALFAHLLSSKHIGKDLAGAKNYANAGIVGPVVMDITHALTMQGKAIEANLKRIAKTVDEITSLKVEDIPFTELRSGFSRSQLIESRSELIGNGNRGDIPSLECEFFPPILPASVLESCLREESRSHNMTHWASLADRKAAGLDQDLHSGRPSHTEKLIIANTCITRSQYEDIMLTQVGHMQKEGSFALKKKLDHHVASVVLLSTLEDLQHFGLKQAKPDPDIHASTAFACLQEISSRLALMADDTFVERYINALTSSSYVRQKELCTCVEAICKEASSRLGKASFQKAFNKLNEQFV